MTPLNIVLSILLLLSAVFLVIAVLMQSGKDKGMGAIGGGSSETYFGKNKGKSSDKKLSLITTIVAIVFAVIALFTFIIQDAPVQVENTDGATTTTTSSKVTTTTTSSSTGDSTGNDSSSSVPGEEGGEGTSSSVPGEEGGEGTTTSSSVPGEGGGEGTENSSETSSSTSDSSAELE